MSNETDGALSVPMSNETRGKAIHERRMALGYSEVAFSQATGVDRGAVRRAEAGTASRRTYERLEVWLDREETHSETVRSHDAGMVELDLTIEPGARAVVRIPTGASPEEIEKWRHELVVLVREVRAEIHPESNATSE